MLLYPFEFIQGDVLALDYEFLLSFDAIHASPPCQQYSCGSALARKRGKVYPDLINPVRRLLVATGLPYIMENVQGAPLSGIGLCGTMFGLGVKRHRIFESNIRLDLPAVPCSCYGKVGEFITVAGSQFTKDDGAVAMGIDWPIDRYQLKEAIPPAYTQFLGRQLLNVLSQETESNRRLFSVSERRLSRVSERPGCSVSDRRPLSVSELPGNSVSEERSLFVSEPRRLPVTRRCGGCGVPLPEGTARRKYCNSKCRLRAFRLHHHTEE